MEAEAIPLWPWLNTAGQDDRPQKVNRCRSDGEGLRLPDNGHRCRSRLPHAPRIYNTDAIREYGTITEEYCTQGVGGLRCTFLNSYSKPIDIDFGVLTSRVKAKLTEAGYSLAFSGFKSGEILVTSQRQRFRSANVTGESYYQIQFLTYPCRGIWNERNICRAFGSASLIIKSPQGRPLQQQDELCSSIENVFTDYIAEANPDRKSTKTILP